MALLHSRITASRFRVLNDGLPEDWRDVYRERLNEFSFTEPPQGIGREEVEGWTIIDDMLESDFSNFNHWLFDLWALFALRVDKKVLPAKKLRTELKRRCRAWATERDVERCPNAVRSEIKDALEQEWLERVMPRTQMYEVAWNLDTNMLYLSTLAEGAADKVRKRFFRTFGCKLMPYSPLDWAHTAQPELTEAILATSPTLFRAPGSTP